MICQPFAALADALSAVKIDTRFARGFTRAATCYARLGRLDMADSVVEKLLDRCTAANSSWADVLKKRAEVRPRCCRLHAVAVDAMKIGMRIAACISPLDALYMLRTLMVSAVILPLAPWYLFASGS